MVLLIMYVYNILALIIIYNPISGNERCSCKIFFSGTKCCLEI